MSDKWDTDYDRAYLHSVVLINEFLSTCTRDEIPLIPALASFHALMSATTGSVLNELMNIEDPAEKEKEIMEFIMDFMVHPALCKTLHCTCSTCIAKTRRSH